MYLRRGVLTTGPLAPLLLSRSDVARHLDLDSCIESVEAAFRAHGNREIPAPAVLGVHVEKGGFHVKAGVFGEEPRYFAAKLNANFMDNRRLGLPTIQGLIALCDATTGGLLAVMDSIEITAARTAAATAVAARYLAREDARVVAICGSGTQGRENLRALCRIRPISRAMIFDANLPIAEQLAAELRPELGIEIQVVEQFEKAVRACDISVTCTPARTPVLQTEWIRPGTFVAGVGADAEHKQELPSDLFLRSLVVVDVLTQCAAFGDLHHALASGIVTTSAVHAELGAVVAGVALGRTTADQITLFDSTGMAVQDVATAALVYRRCCDSGYAASQFRFNS